MDTAKVANLFSCYPEADLLEFVNAPVGKGTPIAKTLKPLVAVPTTAGTGSETTGTAIFDYTPLSAKTGIASRAMRPSLGIVDPLNTVSVGLYMPCEAGLRITGRLHAKSTLITWYRSPALVQYIFQPAWTPSSTLWSHTQLFHTPLAARDLTIQSSDQPTRVAIQ